jgi:hypothetical protein
MMQDSVTMVEQRIQQVDQKIIELKKKEAEEKIASKVDDPSIIGKQISKLIDVEMNAKIKDE